MGEPLSVKFIKTIFRADPYIAHMILIDLVDQAVGEVMVCSIEPVTLCRSMQDTQDKAQKHKSYFQSFHFSA